MTPSQQRTSIPDDLGSELLAALKERNRQRDARQLSNSQSRLLASAAWCSRRLDELVSDTEGTNFDANLDHIEACLANLIEDIERHKRGLL